MGRTIWRKQGPQLNLHCMITLAPDPVLVGLHRNSRERCHHGIAIIEDDWHSVIEASWSSSVSHSPNPGFQIYRCLLTCDLHETEDLLILQKFPHWYDISQGGHKAVKETTRETFNQI